MPLTRSVKKNVKELLSDNRKKGKAKGARGKKRSMKQILAISYSVAKKSKSKKR